MKIFQFLVIGVSAVIALSSAERDGGPGGSRHYESDDSGESEEAYKDYMRCISEMERCMDTLSKYHGFEAVQTLAQIKNAGAQTVCSELLEAHKCVSEKNAQPFCRDLFDASTRRMYSSMNSVVDYVCTDKLFDLQKHWDCAVDENIILPLSSCVMPSHPGQRNCLTPPYTDCVTRIVSSSPNCKSGAVEFVDSIMNRFPFAVFGCPDHKKPAKSLKKF